MSYVIGIDTGGTYTDTVLLDTEKRGPESIIKKAKSFTTHEQLEIGIMNSLGGLMLDKSKIPHIEKVVLSTTLATNAIVENNIHKVGLLIIGDMPKGEIAADYVETIPGKMNIKGRALVNVNKEATLSALRRMLPHIEAVAISGASSVRNPMHELEVKKIVTDECGLPVMCGHELINRLGYLERTNTVAINAGLLPIVNRFLGAIENVLKEMGIMAPIYVVKGDGSIATEKFIKNRPIETVLSGPAASMIGTINLTGIDDAIVADMGGTTTDIGIVKNKRVKLSAEGATVGNWKISIKSAKIHTFGLGGDSQISNYENGFKIGPKRALPACRGGKEGITPTDLLHVKGEFTQWNQKLAFDAVDLYAKQANKTTAEYVEAAEQAVIKLIYDENVARYKQYKLPICAIGAPANSWYGKVKRNYDYDLIIPESYEVANAVGAATAGIQETVEAIIRPGEEGHGYLIHTMAGRFSLTDKGKAVTKALEVSKEYAESLIVEQDLELDRIEVTGTDIFMNNGELVYYNIDFDSFNDIKEDSGFGQFVETRIKVSVNGKSFI